jgi:hypothetical protein
MYGAQIVWGLHGGVVAGIFGAADPVPEREVEPEVHTLVAMVK